VAPPRLVPIASAGPPARAALLALNNAHAAETSLLTEAEFDRLADQAAVALMAPPAAGFVLAMAPDAGYESPNFRWFKSRFEAFLYVDRVIVDAAHRGRGLARALYGAVVAHARHAGLARIVCEVNQIPPNPGSDAFHARLGFQTLETVALSPGKTVRYLAKPIDRG